jgi:hypothetical protein
MSPAGPLLPVHDRQLLEELQPVSRFVPRPAAFESRAVVISARRSAALDPYRRFAAAQQVGSYLGVEGARRKRSSIDPKRPKILLIVVLLNRLSTLSMKRGIEVQWR